MIEIYQSQSENFRNKKLAPKITRPRNSMEYPAIWLVEFAFLIKKKKKINLGKIFYSLILFSLSFFLSSPLFYSSHSHHPPLFFLSWLHPPLAWYHFSCLPFSIFFPPVITFPHFLSISCHLPLVSVYSFMWQIPVVDGSNRWRLACTTFSSWTVSKAQVVDLLHPWSLDLLYFQGSRSCRRHTLLQASEPVISSAVVYHTTMCAR